MFSRFICTIAPRRTFGYWTKMITGFAAGEVIAHTFGFTNLSQTTLIQYHINKSNNEPDSIAGAVNYTPACTRNILFSNFHVVDRPFFAYKKTAGSERSEVITKMIIPRGAVIYQLPQNDTGRSSLVYVVGSYSVDNPDKKLIKPPTSRYVRSYDILTYTPEQFIRPLSFSTSYDLKKPGIHYLTDHDTAVAYQ